MSTKEWLPITNRNRVALGLAGLALVMFVTWNCLPLYGSVDGPPMGLTLQTVWPEIVSPDNYLMVLKSPEIEGFLVIAASVALLQNGLMTLLLMPCWKILHGSAFIRLPLAVANLFGGSVVLWFLLEATSENPPRFHLLIFSLMALSMFTISAALFIFKNELSLRNERYVSQIREHSAGA